MRAALIITLIAACSTLAHANDLPDAPIPKVESQPRLERAHSERLWLAETATLGALVSADLTLTARGLGAPCLPACGRMRETNPIMGPHPSNARLALVGGVIFATESLVLRRTERSHHKWIRVAGRVGFGAVVAGHAQGIRSWAR